MRMSPRIWSMIAVIGLLTYPCAPRAGTIVSNLGQSAGVSSPSQIDPTDFWAQEFTTGGSFTLGSVIATLGDLNTGDNHDFTVTAQLFSVPIAGDTPDQGTLVASFTQNGAISPNGFSNVEFDPTKAVSLNSSSFYWFVLSGSSSDGSGSAQWQFTDSTAETGPGTLTNFAFFSSIVPPLGWSPGDGSSPFLIDVNSAVGRSRTEFADSGVHGLCGHLVRTAADQVPPRRLNRSTGAKSVVELRYFQRLNM